MKYLVQLFCVLLLILCFLLTLRHNKVCKLYEVEILGINAKLESLKKEHAYYLETERMSMNNILATNDSGQQTQISSLLNSGALILWHSESDCMSCIYNLINDMNRFLEESGSIQFVMVVDYSNDEMFNRLRKSLNRDVVLIRNNGKLFKKELETPCLFFSDSTLIASHFLRIKRNRDNNSFEYFEKMNEYILKNK
jgi:hypothetical protein